MAKKNSPVTKSWLEKADDYFLGKENMVFWISVLLTLVFGLLVFELKISLGGDDAMYINRGSNFITKGTFPTFQGPLYPITLGILIYAFGMSLPLLKFFSLLCLLITQWFTYRLFRNRLSSFMLFVFLILISTSAAILYYGSSTYSETFYLCLQSIFLFQFAQSFILNDEDNQNFRRDIGKMVLSGFLIFLMAITKNVGLVAVAAVCFYFLLQRNWKYALGISGSFVVFAGLFKIIKGAFWEVQEMQISSQLASLLNKNPYKPQDGTEDFAGFIARYFENSWVYLGYHFRNIFGMASDEYIRGNIGVALFIYAVFIYGFFVFRKRSKFWMFIAIFTAFTFGVSFFILQTSWIQERLIMVFALLLAAYLLHVLHYIFTVPLRKFSKVFVIFLVILLTANFARTVTRIPAQIKANQQYISGDKYYGFDIDWVNYLKMAKWANDNLPKDAYVACRKPGMAFIYSGGRDFYGIWNVPSQDPEVLYKKLKDAGVTHVIMANLRTNPGDPDSRIINTIQRYLGAINEAYPGKIKPVHRIGEEWPAYIYELN